MICELLVNVFDILSHLILIKISGVKKKFELQGVLSSCFLIFFSCFYMLFLVLWNVYGECENFSTLKGHAGAIMDLHFSTDGR